jgi:hypothetical protein
MITLDPLLALGQYTVFITFDLNIPDKEGDGLIHMN